MAAVMLLRRRLTAAILHKISTPAASARPFTTNHFRESDVGDVDSYVSPQPTYSPTDFEGVINPFFPSWSLMEQMEQDGPLGALVAMGIATYPRRDFDMREDDASLYIRIDMPGLGEEHVKVRMEDDKLVVDGDEGGEETRTYNGYIRLDSKKFKTEEVKFEMKKGVLMIVVPKVTEASVVPKVTEDEVREDERDDILV